MTPYHEHQDSDVERSASLSKLKDAIFRGVPAAEAEEFLAACLDVVRPGADLSQVETRMRWSILADEEIGLRRIADLLGVACIDAAVDLIWRDLYSDKPSLSEWSAVRDAARIAARNASWDGAWDAAWAAAKAATRGAARATACVAVSAVAKDAARDAVRAAANVASCVAASDAAEIAARTAAWKRIAQLLLIELAHAPKAIEVAS